MTITVYTRNVGRAILNTVFKNTVRRVNKCLETGGGKLAKLPVNFCIVMLKCTETFDHPVYVYVCNLLQEHNNLLHEHNTVHPAQKSFTLYI